MDTVFRKALWEQRRSLPSWALGVATLIVLEAALWPSMRSMAGLEDYLAEFPPALQELFAIDEMSTGTGFLNAELFSLMLPLAFIVFGIGLGARLIAGEQEMGTLDLLLVTPLTTTRLLLQDAAALVLSVGVLGLTVLTSTMIGSTWFDLGIEAGAALAGATAMFLLGIEFGLLALVTGALTGRRGLAVALAAGLALAAYLLYVAGLFVDDWAEWRAFSPFDQALHAGPLATGMPGSFAWLAAVPLATVAVALPLWGRRDL